MPTKVCTIKAMVFPVVMYTCKTWTIKKAEFLTLLNCGAGEDLRVPWTARRSNQSILQEISFSSVQLLSRIWLSVTPWTTAHQASLSITNCRSPPKPMSVESVMPSNPLVLCHPLLLLPSIFPSISLFQWVSSSHQVATYWSFSFNISPSNEHPGLISFRMDWLNLLSVQGTCKSLLQHPSSKASILRCSAFFIVQLSHLYTTTQKIMALHMDYICVRAKLLQLCPALCGPMHCSPPGSSVLGILQERVLEWAAVPSSRGSSKPWDETLISLLQLLQQADCLLLSQRAA